MANQRAAWRLLLLLAGTLAMLSLFFAAACGDDDDDDDDGGNGEPTATMDDGNGDGNGDSEPTDPPDDGDGNGNGDGDILGELEDFASDYEGATGVVSYSITGDLSGDGGTWTLYSDGENSRVDVEFSESTYISISTPENTYTCLGSGAQNLCYGGENSGPVTNPALPLFQQYGSADAISGYLSFGGVDVNESSEEVAGVDASCYTASGDFGGDSGTVQWCFADNGLLLVSEYDLGSGTFGMRATEYSSDVPGDAFEPPYDVTSF